MHISPIMKDINVSAFFPCFNEKETFQNLVVEAIHVLNSLVEKHEILITNDGSIDKTGAIPHG
jgi:glycosyltransferase involved in cell wall biosynthesis